MKKNLFKFLRIFSIALLGLSVPVSVLHDITMVEAQSTNVDWPQLQHDPQHTGRTASSLGTNYGVAWAWTDKTHKVQNFVSGINKSVTDGFGSSFQFSNIFAEQMQPIVAGGKAYFGAMNGTMFAVDALTGNNRWDFTSSGPILSTAAYANSILVFTSMDGKIYGLDANTGVQKWMYMTGAGINSAPIINANTVFVGSRDGYFYAVDLNTGALKWRHLSEIPGSPTSPSNGAQIVAPGAVSEDGGTVVYGSENMYLYALNTADGSERWTPKKLIGQSFLYTWPVIKGGIVLIRTMASTKGAEGSYTGMEEVLAALPANISWSAEKAAIMQWLANNPYQKTMYVFNISDGSEPYQVAMGRVTGNNYSPHPAVIDNQNRILTYWRARTATFVGGGSCFGTSYCPDISAMDPTTGDRVTLNTPTTIHPELDNGFALTTGGNFLYMTNPFRGTRIVNMTNGASTFLSTALANFDGGNNRYGGGPIVFYGNDSQPGIDTIPSKQYSSSIGFSGGAVATTNGTTLLYVNEGDVGFIVAYKGQ